MWLTAAMIIPGIGQIVEYIALSRGEGEMLIVAYIISNGTSIKL